MIEAARSIDDLIVNNAHEIHVNASLDVTFDALLKQLGERYGPGSTGQAQPGGRPGRLLVHLCLCDGTLTRSGDWGT